jgi:(p)ppGpp synthase/HD superfamily hydrolase
VSPGVTEAITRPAFVAGSELLVSAFDLAREAHRGQMRKDGSPYVLHPIAVARLVHEAGGNDAMVVAALLHDVVEDSEHLIGEIVERFGADVGELVAALTEDKSIAPYERRKVAHRDEVEAAGPRATAIYVADKLANLRDMRALYAIKGERASEAFNAPIDVRIRLWRGDMEMAARAAPELSMLARFREELDALDVERDRRRDAVASR